MNKRSSLNNYCRAFAYTCCVAFVLLSACKKNDDQSGNKPNPNKLSDNIPVPPDTTTYYLSFEFHHTSGQYKNSILVFMGTWWPGHPYTQSQELFDPIRGAGTDFDGKVIRIPAKRNQISTLTDCYLIKQVGQQITVLTGGFLSVDYAYNDRFKDTTYHIVLKY